MFTNIQIHGPDHLLWTAEEWTTAIGDRTAFEPYPTNRRCVTLMIGIKPADVDRERVRENARKLALGIKNVKTPWEPDTELAQAYADEAEEVKNADWALGD